MKIILNSEHTTRLLWFFKAWLVYVALLVVIGWGFKPRVDEVLFVAGLPLLFLPLYAVACFLAAVFKISLFGLGGDGIRRDSGTLFPKRHQATGKWGTGRDGGGSDLALRGRTSRINVLRPTKKF